MDSLWTQLEPILSRVEKPARYIGCEDGMQRPVHHPSKVAWLLAYPDIYDKWAWPETYMHPSVLPLMQAACFFAALALAIRISRLLFEWDVEC